MGKYVYLIYSPFIGAIILLVPLSNFDPCFIHHILLIETLAVSEN